MRCPHFRTTENARRGQRERSASAPGTWTHSPLNPREFLLSDLLSPLRVVLASPQFARPVQFHAISVFSQCPLLNVAASSDVNFCLCVWLILFPCLLFFFFCLKRPSLFSLLTYLSRCSQAYLFQEALPCCAVLPESQ